MARSDELVKREVIAKIVAFGNTEAATGDLGILYKYIVIFST